MRDRVLPRAARERWITSREERANEPTEQEVLFHKLLGLQIPRAALWVAPWAQSMGHEVGERKLVVFEREGSGYRNDEEVTWIVRAPLAYKGRANSFVVQRLTVHTGAREQNPLIWLPLAREAVVHVGHAVVIAPGDISMTFATGL